MSRKETKPRADIYARITDRIVADALTAHEPPAQGGRRPRFYYTTQVSVKPPTFALFDRITPSNGARIMV